MYNHTTRFYWFDSNYFNRNRYMFHPIRDCLAFTQNKVDRKLRLILPLYLFLYSYYSLFRAISFYFMALLCLQTLQKMCRYLIFKIGVRKRPLAFLQLTQTYVHFTHLVIKKVKKNIKIILNWRKVWFEWQNMIKGKQIKN